MNRCNKVLRISSTSALHCGFVLALAVRVSAGQEETGRRYQLERRADDSGYELAMKTISRPSPGFDEALVRVRAAALNGGLDAEMLEAIGPDAPDFTGRVPMSDAAGEVVAIGDGVSRFSVGDRVVTTYVPGWIDGDLDETLFDSIRGIRATEIAT